jgi:hypothetical protein
MVIHKHRVLLHQNGLIDLPLNHINFIIYVHCASLSLSLSVYIYIYIYINLSLSLSLSLLSTIVLSPLLCFFLTSLPLFYLLVLVIFPSSLYSLSFPLTHISSFSSSSFFFLPPISFILLYLCLLSSFSFLVSPLLLSFSYLRIPFRGSTNMRNNSPPFERLSLSLVYLLLHQ